MLNREKSRHSAGAWLFLVVAAVSTLLAVAACSSRPALTGHWKYTIPGYGVPDIPVELTVEEGGTYYERYPTLQISSGGTWEWVDGKYALTVSGRRSPIVFIEHDGGRFIMRTYMGDALDGLELRAA